MEEASTQVIRITEKGRAREVFFMMKNSSTALGSEEASPKRQPSTVLCGETSGATLCFPNRLPPTSAAVSQIQVATLPTSSVCAHSSVTEMTISRLKRKQG